MRLTRVMITGLFGLYDFDIPINRNVTILTGSNGVGKTTILNIIHLLCSNCPLGGLTGNYKSATLTFDNGVEVTTWLDETGDRKKEWRDANGHVIKYNSDILTINRSYQLYCDACPIETSIDHYNHYVRMVEGLINQRRQQSSVSEDIIKKECYDPLNWFMVAIRALMPYWRIGTPVHDPFGLKFRHAFSGEEIAPERLSNGEKWLLTTLIDVVLMNGRGGVAIFDNPDLGLHIEWQQKLLRVINEINPGVQIIMATHSPSVLYEGWQNCTINLDRIRELRPSEPQTSVDTDGKHEPRFIKCVPKEPVPLITNVTSEKLMEMSKHKVAENSGLDKCNNQPDNQ